MKKAKIIGTTIISLLVLIIFLQNTQSAESELLFVTIKMPIVILLMLTVLIGFIGGLVTKSYVLQKLGKAEAKNQRWNSKEPWYYVFLMVPILANSPACPTTDRIQN